MLYDFHTHTFLSDGTLSPIELIHRAFVRGYTAIALTDHVALGSLQRIIKEISDDCALARDYWKILAFRGIELTHLPPQAIAEVASKAKELGAKLVIVHGETTTEPVEKGTNLAAVQCPHVDILAHPGLITPEEALLAAQNNVFLELTSRHGHNLTNSHIATIAQKTGAKLLVNSDAHDNHDLLAAATAFTTASASGLTKQQCHSVLTENPLLLLQKLNKRLQANP